MKTQSIKPKDIRKSWVIVDASERNLGRLASDISYVLRGKHKPYFVPHLDCGDNVVVVNAQKVHLTGQKLEKKVYYHHTGYIGGIKGKTAKELLEKKPEDMLFKAVKGMLPKNKLANKLMKNLKVYAGSEHPHSAQNPQPITIRTKSGE